ncbi:MAG: DNA polymerase I, partial [SAR324 cluster bacterium]|nr:DNA polymerase I [SAR324 cluster bacterium]
MNSKGLNTSGIRTFLMQLIKIIEEDKPDYLAVASDSMEPTFRHKRFPEYKATREKMPEDLVEQLPYLPRLVEALNLPYLILPGYEADDIVGTLMRLCREAEIEGVMVTSDKDYMQLIGEKIVMLNHRNERIGISGVQEKFGCVPEQVVEMLGLMGDSSDNIPGVRGVGEKTAVKLISEFGSIEGVYENLERISGKSLKEKLETDHENAFLSRELATIDCHVPLSSTLEDVHLGETDLYNNDELYALLEELEFRTLMNRLIKKRSTVSAGQESGPADAEVRESSQDDNQELLSSEEETDHGYLEVECSVIETAEQLRTLINEFSNKSRLALALDIKGEHQLDLWLKGLAFCADAEKAVYIDLDRTETERTEIIGQLKTVLESAEHLKIFYDLKKAVQLFSKLGIQIEGVESDILLAAHMTDSLGRRYDLDYLLGRKLNMKRKSRESADASKQSQMNMFEESDEEDYTRHCENAAIVFQLHELLKAQLKQTGMEGAYRNIEI